jgi:hypothetical protein
MLVVMREEALNYDIRRYLPSTMVWLSIQMNNRIRKSNLKLFENMNFDAVVADDISAPR